MAQAFSYRSKFIIVRAFLKDRFIIKSVFQIFTEGRGRYFVSMSGKTNEKMHFTLV